MGEHLILQKHMDEAYKLHPADGSHSSFHKLLSPVQLTAVHVGNMNYQVENGGWSQWFDNGYGKLEATFVFLQTLFTQVGTPSAIEAKRLMTQALAREHFFEEQLDEGENYEALHSEANETFGNVDEEYYRINQQLMDDVEAFIDKTYK